MYPSEAEPRQDVPTPSLISIYHPQAGIWMRRNIPPVNRIGESIAFIRSMYVVGKNENFKIVWVINYIQHMW